MNNCVGFVKMFIANLYVTMFLVINTTYKIMTQLLVANTITCWCKYFFICAIFRFIAFKYIYCSACTVFPVTYSEISRAN